VGFNIGFISDMQAATKKTDMMRIIFRTSAPSGE